MSSKNKNYNKNNNKYVSKNETHETVGLNNKVTSLEQLRMYAEGSVIELPSFGEGQPFIAKIRRPSIMAMAKSGKIPNKLMSTANSLFKEGGSSADVDDDEMLSQMYEFCEIVADSALIKPSLNEIKEAGLELTDEQLLALFNYAQSGVKGLDSFR